MHYSYKDKAILKVDGAVKNWRRRAYVVDFFFNFYYVYV
jgi:hypothetical protein